MKNQNFINKARLIHGDKYDYSKVEYTDSKTKVCIICPIHGEFWQTPNNHLSGRGCNSCRQVNLQKKFSKTTDDFISEAKKIHGDKYDYSKVEYVNAYSKVCIICKEHGEFWQTPHSHLCGNGCKLCANKKKRQNCIIPYNQVVEKFKTIHGDKYVYLSEEESQYADAKHKLKILCPIHGEFWITPNSHLNGIGCSKCSKKYHYNTEEFIAKLHEIHGDKYDYSKVKYINSKTKVCLICPIHGEFWVTPDVVVNKKQGCPKCSYQALKERQALSTEDFIERAKKVHGDKYDYSKVKYINNSTEVCIICPNHGEFWQKPSKHLVGHGCQHCKSSHLEEEIALLLKANNIDYVYQANKHILPWLGKQSLDFYLPKYNIAIECQGEQHFQSVEHFGGEDSLFKLLKLDKKKKDLCETHNILLLYYSNLGIDYPYMVYEDKNRLLSIIQESL